MEKAKEGRVLTKERIIVVLVLVVILALIPDLLVARYWGRKDREVYQGHKDHQGRQFPDQYKQLVYYILFFQMDRTLCIQIVMVLENME
jgi:hypothetical protein